MLSELHPAIREALAIHEGMRRLGFLPAQIYLNLMPGKLAVTVIRETEASILAGECALERGELERKWSAATKSWNELATEEERRELWDGSKVRHGSVHVVANLVALGFQLGRGRDA